MITPEMIEAARKAYVTELPETALYPSEFAMRAALEAALALLPGEPVAWLWLNDGLEQLTFGNRKPVDNATPLYAAPAPQPVAVKALEWKETTDDTGRHASAITRIGSYDAFELRFRVRGELRIKYGWSGHWLNGDRDAESFEAAKAAAQADYEARIRSALSSPAASDIAALREENSKRDANNVGLGMAIAAAILMRVWGKETQAREILGAAGLTTEARLREIGVEDYDLDELRPILDEDSSALQHVAKGER